MTPRDDPAPDTAPPALQRTSPSVWAWTGELDVADVTALSTAWWSLLEEHPGSVVIDLSGVTFLDCAVLSVLVCANNDPGTRLLLRGVPAHVEQMMQLTGLGSAFDRTGPPVRSRSAVPTELAPSI